jgi:hypothetical protein
MIATDRIYSPFVSLSLFSSFPSVEIWISGAPTMSDYRTEIEDLLARAEMMGHGLAQVALTDEAVRLADLHGDIDCGFEARQDHVNSTMFAGLPEQMLVAFSWCLAQFDQNPENFDTHRLLWQYKWVVNALPDFPQISRAQMEEMFIDMARRYEADGASQQSVWLKRRAVAMKMGDRAAAGTAQNELAKCRRDSLSDCHACEIDANVEYYFFQDDDEQGVAKAAPILQGRYSCGEVPHLTYAQLLLPLLRLKRGDEAMKQHMKGYRMISGNPGEFVPQLAYHMQFLALTGNFPKAIKILEKNLQLVMESACFAWHFDFYLAGRILMERLGESGRQTIKLRLPDAFPLRNEAGEYSPLTLAEWFNQQLLEMASRFDARNGNDYFRRRIDEVPTIKALAANIPLPTRPEGEAPGRNYSK